MKKPPDKLPPYKTIKTSLKSVVKNPEVQEKLMDVVLIGNKLVQHTYQFIKLYFLYCYDNKTDLPLLTREFIVNVMKVLCVKNDARGKKPNEKTLETKAPLEAFFKEHYASTMVGEPLTYTFLANVMAYLSTDILTVFETNIKQHFVEYIERFINVLFDSKAKTATMSKEDKYAFISKLRKYKTTIFDGKVDDVPEELKPHIGFIIPNRPFKKDSLYYDLKCNPQDYIKPMIYMMKFVEGKDATVFQIFPLRSNIVPKYVPFDTTTLVQLFGGSDGLNKGELLTSGNLKKYENKIWSWTFKTNKSCFRAKNYAFDHRISTDGEGISILLMNRKITTLKEKRETVESSEIYLTDIKKLSDYKDTNIVGIDPNMEDIIFCSGKTKDGLKHFRYTRMQRKKETKSKKYRNIHNELKKKTFIDGKTVEQWETDLSSHNKKTLDFEKFKAYVIDKNIFTHKLNEFYQQRIYRQLKWYGFINRQKSESSMINRFKSIYGTPEDTTVFIGDWEQFKHRKYKEPSIGKGIRNVFRKAGYEVVLVDEFRTSCRCCKCEGECETFRKCNNPKPWNREQVVTRHGLLMCKTCSGLWNRDVNSSLNILKIVENTISGLGRPKYLDRVKSDSGATSASGRENQRLPKKKLHTTKLSRGCEASTLDMKNKPI